MKIQKVREVVGAPSFTVGVPKLGWPPEGIIIGNRRAAIACTGNYLDHQSAPFSGWSYEGFHYCPSGKWADWVDLAKKILAADAALSAIPPTQ